AVDVYVSSATINATSAITLLAASYSAPKARTLAGAFALIGAGGGTFTYARDLTSTRAHMDGNITGAGTTSGATSLTVTAISTAKPDAASSALAAGIITAGAAAQATAEV